MYEKLKIKSDNKKKTIKIGTVIHSNDKYFLKSKGFSKNRESVIVGKGEKGNALVKLTSQNTANTAKVPDYEKESYFDVRNLYTKDNAGNYIAISDKTKIDELNKFIKSNWPEVPISSVELIKKTVISDLKYGKRNKRRLDDIE